MAEIHKIYTKTAGGEEEAVVSIDAGMVVAIGEGRNLTMRTLIDRSLPFDEQARVLREMLQLADLEKAKYELRDYEGLRVVQKRALDGATKNVQNVAVQYKERLALIEIEIGELRSKRGEADERHHKLHQEKYRGVFRPTQAYTNELADIDRQIETLESERKKIHEDIDGNKQGLMQQLANARLQLQTTEEEIAKRRVILGLPEEAATE